MSNDKCCGNCKHFKNEDVEGWGWCSLNKTKTHCAQSWNCHNSTFNGWTEITPDNVDDIEEAVTGRLSIAYVTKKGYVLYGVSLPLKSMAKNGGFYYYVLPELKIE